MRDLLFVTLCAKSALRAVRNNVVGQGIKHQAQVRMIRGGRLDERLNGLIEFEFARWSKASNCHWRHPELERYSRPSY